VTSRALIVLFAAGLTACPPPRYGFFQYGELEKPPERDCVQTAIESRADPGSVSSNEMNGTWYVEYTRDATRYGVHVSPRGNPPSFMNNAWGERETPKEALELMRRRVREVTSLVQDQCGVDHLVARVAEQCGGIHCDELPKE